MRGSLIAFALMILALPACATKWKGYNRYSATGETIEKESANAKAAIAANQYVVPTTVISDSGTEKDPLVCGWEPALGSNIRERVCREEEDLYWNRQGVQTWMEAYLHTKGITRD